MSSLVIGLGHLVKTPIIRCLFNLPQLTPDHFNETLVLVCQLQPYLPRPIIDFIVNWLVDHNHNLYCMRVAFEY